MDNGKETSYFNAILKVYLKSPFTEVIFKKERKIMSPAGA